MDAENMFNISVDLYKTINKAYPIYDIPKFVFEIMLNNTEDIFKNSMRHKYSYYNMKHGANVIHIIKLINTLSETLKENAYRSFTWWIYKQYNSQFYEYTQSRMKRFDSVGRYKNINKWFKIIKYYNKEKYNQYIKPIIRYINKPKLSGTYSIKPFDINEGLDIFETASYNSDELKSLNEALSNYTQSFRVLVGTNIAIIRINQHIDFIPLRNAINIIKKAEPPNIKYPKKFYEDDNITNDEIRKAYFFRQFEKYKHIYDITYISFNIELYKQKIYHSLFDSHRDTFEIYPNKNIYKELHLYHEMPFLNISEASSKNVNDDVDTFFDLLRNMFINEEDATYFIKYIAWIIQNPGYQSGVVPVLHTSKNTSHIIKHITKMFQNYAYTTSKSIYDKMKRNYNYNYNLNELLCKMLVIIDEDLPLYEDMSNFSTKYQTSNKNYKPSEGFKTFVKKDSHINIKVKGSETLQLKNTNNYIVLSSDIYSYIMKSKDKQSNINYFIPRLCLSNICNDIKYPSIKNNFHTFYRELTLRFVKMSLKDFDINKVPEFEYSKNIYRTSFHKTNAIYVLLGVLMNLNALYDKFPIRLIRRIIYEITSVQSYKLLSDVLLCNMKELTLKGEQVFSYLFTKFRDVDCKKIMSKLNIYFEPAGYSSFNKFLHTYENYGINSNTELDFLCSDKSEKFIKFNTNRLQQLESLKIEIYKCIKPKHNEDVSNSSIQSNDLYISSALSIPSEQDKSDVLNGLDDSNNLIQPNDSNIAIEIQNDSIVIHLNSMKH